MGSYIHPSVLTKRWVVLARLVLKLGKLPAFIPRNSQLKQPVVPQNYIPCYTKLGISPNVLRWLLLPKKSIWGTNACKPSWRSSSVKIAEGSWKSRGGNARFGVGWARIL